MREVYCKDCSECYRDRDGYKCKLNDREKNTPYERTIINLKGLDLNRYNDCKYFKQKKVCCKIRKTEKVMKREKSCE